MANFCWDPKIFGLGPPMVGAPQKFWVTDRLWFQAHNSFDVGKGVTWNLLLGGLANYCGGVGN